MVNILYNPLANNGQGERIREELSAVLKRNPDIIGISTEGSSDEKEKNNGIRFIDITLVGDISNVLDSFDSGDVVIIAGGDGTLNKFLNNTYGKNYRQKLFFIRQVLGMIFFTIISSLQEKSLVLKSSRKIKLYRWNRLLKIYQSYR